MKRLPALLLVPIFLLFITCTKQDPLPHNTETGQNTFGCLIDSKAYIPDGGPAFSGLKPVTGGFLLIGSKPLVIGIYINTYAKSRQRINLYLENFALGNHLLNNKTGVKPAALYPRDYASYDDSDGNQYVTSSTHTDWINLTKADTTTGVVAGTFEFRAATSDSKTVNITQGRFDVNHRTQ